MDKENINMKQCFVLLDPCTPKKQIALSAELRKVIDERNVLTSRTKKKIFSALDALDASDSKSRRESRKSQAVQEILDSEASYLKQLENIMTFFMKPIKDKSILSETEYDLLFGNIDTLYKVNGELLHALKQDLLNVTSAFSKLAPFFKIYSVYAYDFKKALSVLKMLHSCNPEFSKLLVNQETRPEVQEKLSSLLITPIQRIPRYCLLLKQVLENTLPTDEDYFVLKESLVKLEGVARHLNSLVAERENSQRLLELLRCLKNGKNLIIQPGRKLIKEGVLNRHGSKSKEKIYLVLMSDIIMCCKIRKSSVEQPNSLKWTNIFPLNKCRISLNSSTKMFEITCQEDSLILYHDKGVECDEWVRCIDEAIDRYIDNRKSLRKGSSSRRPAGVSNSEDYKDAGISPGVSMIRKRRNTDAKREKNETNKIIKLEESDNQSTSCLPLRLLKRKSFHKNVESSRKGEEKKDCLFPLRAHFMNEGSSEPEESKPSTEIVPYRPDIFVFGRENNQHRTFSFRVFNALSGISNSLKRVFGFN